MYFLMFLVPIIIVFISWMLYPKKIHLVEASLVIAISWLVTFITYSVITHYSIEQEEYNSFYVKEIRYYEYWETWEQRTCSREVACGTYTTGSGNNKVTHTRYCTQYYDCSYCDRHPERFEGTLNNNSTITINKEKYLFYKKLWGNSTFVDLNRSIHRNFQCGTDGDMYKSSWDGKIKNHFQYSTITYYQNYLKHNKSVFNFSEIDSISLKELYRYPKLLNNTQEAVKGNPFKDADRNKEFKTYMRFINSYYGHSNKVQFFTLFFENKPLSIAKLQESYWLGGNQNEIVVCIGVKDEKIEWVYVFSWCDNKILHIGLREELSKDDKITKEKFYNIYKKSLRYYNPKDFEDFNYIEAELSDSQEKWLVWITIITIIVGVVVARFNNIDSDNFK